MDEMMRHILTFMLLSLLCGMSAEAQLVWRDTEQRRSVELERAETSFFFYFRNGGQETVEITKVVRSCGCLSESLDKKTVEPGESGVLKVTMSLNDFEVDLDKSLMVTTSDRPDKPVRLGLSVHIPKGYRLSARRLIWESSDSEPKSVSLINQSDKPVPLVSADCSTSDFTVELISVREGFEYEVSIRPVAGRSSARAVVSVRMAAPQDGSPARIYSIYLVSKGVSG